MQKVLTAAEMRDVDRLTTEKFGIPSIILMENAAHAVARVITEKLGGTVKGKSIIILCGKGSNGGDGAALARILWTMGANCFVYLAGKVKQTKGDARVNFEILQKISESDDTNGPNENCLYLTEMLDDAIGGYVHKWREKETDVLVDALFGTGFAGPLSAPFDKIVAALGSRRNLIRCSLLVSIDVPSGLNSDDEFVSGEASKADLTVTFTAPKPANVLPPASNRNGRLVIANIGSPNELIESLKSQLYLAESSDAKRWLESTKFTADSYKNIRGHAIIIAGSANYSGAAVLAANAAMRSGAGMVTLITPTSLKDTSAARLCPEVMLRGAAETGEGSIAEAAFDEISETLARADAVAIGCGLSRNEETGAFVAKVIENRIQPLIIDADALSLISPFRAEAANGKTSAPLILTPHEGEFLRLLGTDDKQEITDRVAAVRKFSKKHGVILVLKGERVLIGEPGGMVVVNPTGNAGLGKAGNGDTLTGIMAGFVAQATKLDIDIFETVVAAVYVAGLAGDIAEKKYGKRVMTASDVRECLSDAFAELGQ